MSATARRLAVVAGSLCLLAAPAVASAKPGNGNGHSHSACNAGRGNGFEFSFDGGTAVTGQPNDCDPGNSGAHNHGGDFNPTGT
jgi:hypothetical protein